MKFLFLSLILIASNSHSQCLDSLGLDNSDYLNACEFSIVDSLLKANSQNNIDIKDKKIAFITGNRLSINGKSDFFNHTVMPRIDSSTFLQIFTIPLNESEQELSGGYEVLLCCWVKIYSEKNKQKVIASLGRKEEPIEK